MWYQKIGPEVTFVSLLTRQEIGSLLKQKVESRTKLLKGSQLVSCTDLQDTLEFEACLKGLRVTIWLKASVWSDGNISKVRCILESFPDMLGAFIGVGVLFIYGVSRGQAFLIDEMFPALLLVWLFITPFLFINHHYKLQLRAELLEDMKKLLDASS
jgi:hypothetical protein